MCITIYIYRCNYIVDWTAMCKAQWHGFEKKFFEVGYIKRAKTRHTVYTLPSGI